MKNSPQIKNKVQFDPFSGPQIESVIHTTKAQSEILIDCLFGGDDAKRAYNLSFSLNFLGDFKFNALERAIEHLVERHESLRASFSEDGAFMSIFSEIAYEISYNDLSNKLEDEKLKLKDALQHQDINYLFDLVKGPLFKASVIKLNENSHIFIITVHHSICDGLSIDVFLEELGVIYSAYAQDKLPNLPKVNPFSLFAEKENLFAESNEYKLSEDFWLNMYQESVPKVELPIDYPRPQLRTYNNHRLDFLIDKNLLNALKHTGINAGCSLVTTLMTAFEVFLYQQTGQNDLVVGLTNSRPAHFDMTQIIGHGVNVLPLRSKVDSKITFNDYLTHRKSQFFDAYEHQSISFGHILEKLSVTRDPSRIPLVPVMLNLELNKNLESEISFHNLSHDLTLNIGDYGTFEIELQAFQSKDGPCFRWKYNTTLFKPDTIKQMMASFEKLIEKLVSNPNKSISKIISGNYNAIYNDFNNTAVSYSNEVLSKLIFNQAQKTPEKIALIFNGKKINYEAFQKETNQLAHYFKEQGVIPGDFIAVSLPRCPELVPILLAIMQCGAAYLPLDPNYPQSRIEFMLKDSGSKFLVTNEHLENSFPKETSKLIVENILIASKQHPVVPLKINIQQESIAYILYTSGSTGKPKGVTITHKNLVNFLTSMAKEPGIKSSDKLLSITTISFDIAGLELFLPLLSGATLVLADDETARDGRLLLELLHKEEITILQATPTTWQMLIDIGGWKQVLPIKALCGGEAMPLKLAQQLLERCHELWNVYGPTETTIWSSLKQIKTNDELITIGKPINNTQIYLLNEDLELVKPGAIGEIVIAGDGVAQGYWKRLELTAEKFVLNPFSKNPKDILYRTGDLGKLLPNNEIQCLGRIDQQVKIRGHRIELEEIESVINDLEGIKQSVVVASNQLGSETKLIAYIKAEDQFKDIKAIRSKLKEILPEILRPSNYMFLDDFPVTPNGKIDKKNLPVPEYKRPDSAPSLKKARTQLGKDITEIWSEQLNVPKVGIDDNFFEIGGSSIIAQKVIALLIQKLDKEIPLTKIFQHPTISQLCEFLGDDEKDENAFVLETSEDKKSIKDIAIIGMAGRFPKAESIEELWSFIRDGKENISFFTNNELDISIPESLKNNPLYVKARGVLPSAKTFDGSFFGLNPLLSKTMDPQQRLFLEICWEVLEQSGHLPKHYKGDIGVYAGCDNTSYHINNLLANKKVLDQVGEYQVYISNSKDFIAPRVAYHLNLKGPAVSIHSACSTSLLAVAEAVQAIRRGSCEVAIAGGSSISSPINQGHLYEEGAIYSPDGHCRSFDADGKGTVFSDGAGVFLLKSLDAAKKDGDTIYGLIKGVGVNNDGGDKGSFMAPSSQGQSRAIIDALNDAQVLPSSISYLEAHGTATPIGDPIEVEGLKMAFGKQERNGYCALGSIKSNLGHTGAAAGAAGLIKAILAMQHKQIPPLVGFTKPNPNIDFANSPFYINDKLNSWDVDGPRRAGVSSFGVGGTNVHIIVEEYEMEPITTSTSRPSQILTWSAKSKNSLSGYQEALGGFIEKSPNALADIAYSLNITRQDFNLRAFSIADSSAKAVNNLISPISSNIKNHQLHSQPREMGFLFPGQGSQYLQMGKTLYDNEKVYQNAIDKCAKLLLEDLELDIRDIIYPENNSEAAEAFLKNTRLTQPALFVTEYALSQLWMSWGIKPTLLCGHSIGEFVAAHLAGIFNLKDALHIIATRGRLISELPGGSMLSVRLPEDQLKGLLPETLSIAAINSNHLCVVSGKDKDIKDFSDKLEAKDILNRILLTSHAFHSSMMNPMLENFEAVLKKATLNAPNLPIISTVTGTWLTDGEATDVSYWVNHLKKTVRFADAMDTALKLDDFILLEVGPGKSLTTLAQQQAAGKIIPVFSSLLFSKEVENNEYNIILNALGNMWIRGVDIDWKSFYKEQERHKINLPSYVFDRKPAWVDPIVNNELHTSYDKETAVIETPKAEPTSYVSERSENAAPVKKEDEKRKLILQRISEIITYLSGINYESDIASNTFLELGLDSLTLTQLSVRLKNEFNLPITFRQLSEEFGTPDLLVNYFYENLPKENLVKNIDNKNLTNASETINTEKVTHESKTTPNLLNVKVTSSISSLNTEKSNGSIDIKKKTGLVINTTKAQSEILTDCFFGGDDAKRAYNISLSLKFEGKLNYDALELALQTLVKRHESLRASFSDDLRLMTIYNSYHVDVAFHDISNQEDSEKQKTQKSLIKNDVNYLFDLINGPLLKISLIKKEQLEHVFTITINHAICDGLSTRVLIDELGALYSAYRQDKESDLIESDSFSVFANQENKFSESDAYKNSEKFWLNMYQESIPKLELPIDFPRPKLRTYDSHRLDFLLDNTLLDALKQTGNNLGSSIVTTLVAAFEVFLYQQTKQDDLVLGLTSSRQANYDMMQMVGHSVNLLPLRSKIDTKISFEDYLEQRKRQLFDAYENQSISFGQLLEKLSIPRDPSRVPLVPVVMNVQLDDDLDNEYSFLGLSKELKLNQRDYGTFEIELQVSMSKDGPWFRWNYNSTLFKPETIKQMMASFEIIIKRIIEDPSKTLDQIIFKDFTSAYSELNATASSYPKSTLHDLFAERVEISPDSIALEYFDKNISYSELGQRINQMAHYLWSKGLRPGQVVAVSLDRSPDLITTLFAILQCGASYVPVDVLFPEARINLMIEDSNATFYIAENSKVNVSDKVISLSITTILTEITNFPKESIDLKVTTESPAYIIYTSGSTGKPKGVQVAHCNVINLIYSMAKEPGITAKDKIFSVTTISFDAMVMEIYLPLIFGACIVLVDEDTRRDGTLLLKKIEKDGITMMWGTPSIWQILINSGWQKPLNIKILIGGEPVPLSLAQELLVRCNAVWNIYGPTETTVCCLLTQILKNDNPITIGKPVANTQIYLLNPQGNPVNLGETGEIAIAGDGVSLGYLNRPELNKERFITNLIQGEAGSKMYLSGDLGKLLPNGQVQCLGRIDKQVKVRGYRIELGEIEHVLMETEGVKSAVVLAENDILIAFILVDFKLKTDIDPIQLCRKELTSKLPSFMVPNVFQVIDKIPTTENGKIDREALLEYKSNSESKKVYTSPRTENEKLIAAIWKENLNLEKIDVFDDFFEMGGHSIKAVKIILDTEKRAGKKIPISSLFQYSTVEKFSKLLETNNDIFSGCLVPIKPSGKKTPIFIVHGAGLGVLNFMDLSKHFDKDQPVYGLQGSAKGYDDWYESIEDMAAHYIEAIIKINPSGPYALAGFSFGGVIAFEMTSQLKKQGKKVILTALLDSYLDSSYYLETYVDKKLARSHNLKKRRLDFLKEMLSSWRGFKKHIKGKTKYLLKTYFNYENTMTEQEALALAEFSTANSMVNKIVDRYHLKPQNFKLDLFRSTNDSSSYRLDPTYLGWEKATTEGISIHDITGNHLEILEPPNDKVLAKLLQDILNERNDEF